MPSPFHGMNPYLEQADVWQDFHNRYIGALGDTLAGLVRPWFFVKSVFHVVFNRAYYKDHIYGRKPTPSLLPEDAAWAASLIAL